MCHSTALQERERERERERVKATSWLYSLYNPLLFLLLFSSILTTVSFADTSKNISTKDTTTFQISEKSQKTYPELVKLIKNTESMDDKEKQYWFDILPSMTDAQAKRLFDILDNERKKLEELELKYQGEIKILNEKHLIEWGEFQIKSTLEKLNKEEAGSVLLLVENPNPNKKAMPYTLIFTKDFNEVEKIAIKDNWEKFDIYKSKNYLPSVLFNQFARISEKKFSIYYKLYGNKIFDILDVYYRNLSYTNELKNYHLDAINKNRVLISIEDKERFKKLSRDVEHYYISTKPFQEVYEILEYYNKEENLSKTNIFYKFYHTLYVDKNNQNEQLKQFLNSHIQEIKKENYKHLNFYSDWAKNQIFETELIIMNLFITKYKESLDKDFIEKINNFIYKIKKDKNNFQNKQSDEHYFEITNLFLDNNHTEINKKFESLKSQYEKCKNDCNEYEDLQAKLLEYGVYIALSKQVLGQDYDDVLKHLKNLRRDFAIYSKANQYLEIKFIDYLQKAADTKKSDTEKQRLKEEAEQSKKDKEIAEKKANLINLFKDSIGVILIIIGILTTLYAFITSVFRGLLLNNERTCNVLDFFLKIGFKFIAMATEKFLIYNLEKWLNAKLTKRITYSIDNSSIDYTNYQQDISECDYTDTNEKYHIAKEVATYFQLLPISLHKSEDLNIGCIDDLLFKKGYTKYLFIVDTSYFETTRELNTLTYNLSDKYHDAKIIVFKQTK